MAAITLDTLQFVERLTAAGVPEAHATARAGAFRDTIAEAPDNTLATKSDLRDLKAELKSEMQAMEMRLTPRG